MWVVIEYDMEEADADQSVSGIYGPFDDSEAAETFATEHWEALEEGLREFTSIEANLICPPEDWDKNHE